MRKSGFIVGSLAGILLIGCGGDDSSVKAPSRDDLVAEIVESAGVSQEEAECSADALFTSLSEDDLAKVLGGGEPSAEGQDAFTDAILDCLSGAVVTEAPETTDAPETTEAPETTAAPETIVPETAVAPETTAALADGVMSQFAASAGATSEYGDDAWSANQATGAPTIEFCGDNSDAWASEMSDGYDMILLGYATPVTASMVNISVSYTPGQIVKVEVIDTAGTATVVYEEAPQVIEMSDCPQLMEIPVPDVANVNTVRITVDQATLGRGWTEIDAVELIGTPS